MRELIQNTKDFKIIPSDFKSSGAFEVLEILDDTFKVKLILSDENELNDYVANSLVEVFGVNSIGLVYFQTKIVSREKDILVLAQTQDYSLIQRREYSRVGINQGKITFKDMEPGFVIDVKDISAGGAKFVVSREIQLDSHYDISISLSNNMNIECQIEPIRINKTQYNDSEAYIVSGKFLNLENVDRIVLVQYAFKIKMEEQNKENE